MTATIFVGSRSRKCVGSVCAFALLAAGCSGREPSEQSNAHLPTIHPIEVTRPPRPIFRRSAAAFARLVRETCLKAIDESANAARFEAILRDFGQTPQPAPAAGRMTAWQLPGGNVAYANSPKGGFAASILCLFNLDPRGAPRADRVARGLERSLGRGPPETGQNVGPWGHPGFRWTYSSRPGARTVLNIADMPRMCAEEAEGCSAVSLAIHISHEIE